MSGPHLRAYCSPKVDNSDCGLDVIHEGPQLTGRKGGHVYTWAELRCSFVGASTLLRAYQALSSTRN